MEFLVVAVILGIIPAAIANRKGRSFFWWWVFGFLLFILALPLSIIAKPATGSGKPFQQCPYCAEHIRSEARVCRHCGRDIPRAAPESE